MREILQLIEEMQAHQKQTARQAGKHRRQIGRRLDEMQADIGVMKKGLEMVQAGVVGLDRSVGGLRADVDQLQAADGIKQEHLGRLARAMNAFVDGYELRLSAIESRVDRLEQKSA